MSLNSWFQHSFYHNSTTATQCCLICHSVSAACDECSGSSCRELVIAWPCETSVEAVTLTASWAMNYIQAVSVYAVHPHLTNITIPVRLCICSFCNQWQILAEVDWFSCSCSAKNKNHIWRTWFLLHCESEKTGPLFFTVTLANVGRFTVRIRRK